MKWQPHTSSNFDRGKTKKKVKNDRDQAFQNVTKIREMAALQLAKGYKCFLTRLGHRMNENGWDQKKRSSWVANPKTYRVCPATQCRSGDYLW